MRTHRNGIVQDEPMAADKGGGLASLFPYVEKPALIYPDNRPESRLEPEAEKTAPLPPRQLEPIPGIPVFVMQIFGVIGKYWWLLLLLPLLTGGGAGAYSYYYQPPVYRAQATLLLQPNAAQNQNLYNTIMGNQQLIRTYAELLQSRKVAAEVAKRLELTQPPESLMRSLTVQTSSVSFVIKLSVDSQAAVEAARIVNEYAHTFADNVGAFTGLNNVMIIDEAKPEDGAGQVQPKPVQAGAMGGAVGFILAVAIVSLIETIRYIRMWNSNHTARMLAEAGRRKESM